MILSDDPIRLRREQETNQIERQEIKKEINKKPQFTEKELIWVMHRYCFGCSKCDWMWNKTQWA